MSSAPFSHFTLFQELLSQPTAPYRETHVISAAIRFLDHHRIPWFQDRVGNIVVGAKNAKDYQKKIQSSSREPLRVFIAHMDHPGFHGVKWLSPKRLKVQWHGGTPVRHLNGAPVWIADALGWVALEGKISKPKLLSSRRSLDQSEIVFKENHARDLVPDAKRLFGAFRFRKPLWKSGKIFYTKCCDDLVGVFSILSLAHHFRKNLGAFVGILTRAEEVGFVGAIGHFEWGVLQKAKKRAIIPISLETSRTLPGAEIGKGPVVRVGDRAGGFDPSYTRVVRDVAEKVISGGYQVRIMDGGTCEATAALAYGLPAVGISVPLGNYHNQNFEGGPDTRGKKGEGGPGPEFVHEKDVSHLLKLCEALMRPGLPWAHPWKALQKQLQSHFQKGQRLLKGH